MAFSKKMKRTTGTAVIETQEPANVVQKSRSKAPGTRVGILLDWREGSAKSGRTFGRCGSVVRDGR